MPHPHCLTKPQLPATAMAFLAAATSSPPSSSSSKLLLRPNNLPKLPFSSSVASFPNSLSPLHVARARGGAISALKGSSNTTQNDNSKKSAIKDNNKAEEEEIEVEEELPWIQEKAMDLVEFTGSVTQAIPGPRVGQSSLPWILAVPLAYVGITFVIAFVKTVKKLSSPKAKRRRLVNKNAMVCKSIDELFHKGGDALQHSALQGLSEKTGFSMVDILRKYIRYALNEKPFGPDLVTNLIELRKASMLDDPKVAEILNEISRRIVQDKGPVVMDMSGYTEKGLNRKVAVQTLFTKIFYLSELPEFCSSDSSLIVKEIFGVTDEDAEVLRSYTFSEAGDMDSLKKMLEGSDLEDSE